MHVKLEALELECLCFDGVADLLNEGIAVNDLEDALANGAAALEVQERIDGEGLAKCGRLQEPVTGQLLRVDHQLRVVVLVLLLRQVEMDQTGQIALG